LTKIYQLLVYQSMIHLNIINQFVGNYQTKSGNYIKHLTIMREVVRKIL